MIYILAVFKNRTNSIAFMDRLNSNGVYATIISTPKQVGSTCGVSVKFMEKYLPLAKKLISFNRSSFSGFYKITQLGDRKIIEIIR